MGCLLGKIKSVAARWCDLEPQLRPSNEAVWGGNLKISMTRKGESEFCGSGYQYTLANRHTQLFFYLVTSTLPSVCVQINLKSNTNFWKDTHARLCCQVENLLFKNQHLGPHTPQCVLICLAIEFVSCQIR